MQKWTEGFQVIPGITLRLWSMNMVDDLVRVAHANAFHLRKWLSWPQPDYNASDAQRFISQMLHQFNKYNAPSLSIWESTKLIGAVNLHHVDRANESAFIGYWLIPQMQGRGIITTTCRILIDDLFTSRGFNRITIAVQPNNTRSRAIPERLHFKQEGILRQAKRQHDRFVDWVIYAMLAEDWRLVRNQ